jgi:hypothetical protein
MRSSITGRHRRPMCGCVASEMKAHMTADEIDIVANTLRVPEQINIKFRAISVECVQQADQTFPGFASVFDHMKP